MTAQYNVLYAKVRVIRKPPIVETMPETEAVTTPPYTMAIPEAQVQVQGRSNVNARHVTAQDKA
jgi:hypothetical protein